MPDETPTVDPAPVTTENTLEQVPTATPEPAAPPEAIVAPDWRTELEHADAEAIRTHPRIQGIIGERTQRAIQAEKARMTAEAERTAAAEAEKRLRQLAEEDPVTFAEQWLGETQKQDLRRQLEDLHGNARRELASHLGRAYQDVPEWGELTQADHEALASALAGKGDDEVMAVFTHKALDIVAERRAQKKLADWKAKEMAKEREAVRQEEAAKLLKTSEAPDTTKPKGTPAHTDINAMSDEEFRQYAARHNLRV